MKNKKILICPHEIGGQMQLMASKFREAGYNATSMCFHQSWQKHMSDIQLNLENKNWFQKQKSKFLFTLWAANNYDIFHFFWGQSLFGTRFHPHLDLILLKKLNKKIFVHFRGIDIVDLKYFDYLYKKTLNPKTDEPPISRDDQIKSINIWQKYADNILVSEPDLFKIVPNAEMVQQTIDMSYWSDKNKLNSYNSSKKIKILHAPTMRKKKGTDIIVDIINGMISEGFAIELILVENIPAKDVKEIYSKSDIAIDQILYGWHGKFSVELMAMKKPVMCYIDEEYYKYRPELPIINVNPLNLKEKIKNLIEDENMRHDIGIKGFEYVKKYHEISSIINQCIEIYKK